MTTIRTIESQQFIEHYPADRFRNLRNMIGNTPLLRIRFHFRGRQRVIYAKAENLNLTGSIKDRMAYHILKRAYQERHIDPGDTIVEATSGNTGISFSAIGKALGHHVVIFMPDWMSAERIGLIRSLGAQITLVSKEDGGFRGCINKAEMLARKEKHIYLPNQFSNLSNVEAHEQMTGPEILGQLTQHGLSPDAFVAGVGTGGTIMGVGRFLRAHLPNVRIHPVEPAESPTLTTGYKVGHHRIQGISDEFIPPIVELGKLDKVIQVHDGDAIIMAQKLAAELGLAVGISSGANFLAALLAQDELGEDAVVATVFPDDNKKYLSTDLLKEEPVKPGYLSPDIELDLYEAFNRVCFACFELDDYVRIETSIASRQDGTH
ncbi:MAG: cysteine synthase family protein [Acidobacteriota bacterium]|nr:MAG: cysteine synthase family protein [Acidobacteriota bacterium]